MKIELRDRKIVYEPATVLSLAITVGDKTEVIECQENFETIILDFAETTTGLGGGPSISRKLTKQLENLGLIRRSTRGSYHRTDLLTREMAKKFSDDFVEIMYPDDESESKMSKENRTTNPKTPAEWAEYSRSGHAPSLEDCFALAMGLVKKEMSRSIRTEWKAWGEKVDKWLKENEQ